MAKAPDPIADYLRDQLGPWAPVAARPLFGGWGLYRGAVMFGLVAGDTIYFRTDAANRGDYEAAGMPPFRYRVASGKTMTMAYSEVPPAVLDDAEELAGWATKAHDAALRVARAKARPKAKPKARPAARSRAARAR